MDIRDSEVVSFEKKRSPENYDFVEMVLSYYRITGASMRLW